MPYANPEEAKVHQRNYYQNNKARINKYRLAWSKLNPEKNRSYKTKSAITHQDTIREYRRIYELAFPEKRLAQVKRYQARNRELVRQRSRDYRRRNPEKVRAFKAKWQRMAKQTNVNFRIKCNLRNRLRQALLNKRTARIDKTIMLLGCSIPDFKIYLESKFEVGMSWETYGKGERKWQIDHIMPCAIFDLTKPEHQRRCFHFSNMQPMWQEHNNKKRASVTTNQFPLL